jgi:hypothetical protein
MALSLRRPIVARTWCLLREEGPRCRVHAAAAPPPTAQIVPVAWKPEASGFRVASMPEDGLRATDYAVIRETRQGRDDGPEPAGWNGLVPVGPHVLLGRIPGNDAASGLPCHD